jgi:DNA replication protein DnaC
MRRLSSQLSGLSRGAKSPPVSSSEPAQNRADPNSPIQPLDGMPECSHCRSMRFLLDVTTGQVVPCPYCSAFRHASQTQPSNALDKYGSDLGRARRQTFFNFKTDLDGKPSTTLQTCREAAELFADELSGWLVVYGRSGNGKSHLAAAVRNHVANRGIQVIYITVPELLHMLRMLFDRERREQEGESFEERLDVYRKAPVLILDDLGAEKMSEWSTETLHMILEYRYRLRLPTMITTNLDPHSNNDFDSRFVTRMTDANLCRVIENTEPNFRNRQRDDE